MSWRPANIEPENNRAWAGVHWLNQDICAESILRPTAARADSTALPRRSELSLITLSLIVRNVAAINFTDWALCELRLGRSYPGIGY
jgi:hypothetical protein